MVVFIRGQSLRVVRVQAVTLVLNQTAIFTPAAEPSRPGVPFAGDAGHQDSARGLKTARSRHNRLAEAFSGVVVVAEQRQCLHDQVVVGFLWQSGHGCCGDMPGTFHMNRKGPAVGGIARLVEPAGVL